jgi:RND family efflux transporter MFP subunit
MKQFISPFLALALLSTPAFAEDQKRPPVNVIVEQLSSKPIQTTIDTVGTAEAKKSVKLYSASADKVTKVTFKPGDYVEKGAALVALDARRQVAALKRANIELAAQRRDVDRLIKSKKKGAVTESAVDEAMALLELAHVAVEEAQADLEDRTVVAPFSGYLGLTDIEVGDRINQSTMITTIDDRSQLFINFSVPESSYNLIAENTDVIVQPWNNRGEVYKASLAQLDSRIDTQNRTLKVRAMLNNADDKLRPGLSFKVTLSTNGTSYPVIPEAALAWGATGSYIWLAKEGKAVKKPVVIKQRLRGTILVEGDLLDGDVLIVEGIQRLREGSSVATQSPMANQDK